MSANNKPLLKPHIGDLRVPPPFVFDEALCSSSRGRYRPLVAWSVNLKSKLKNNIVIQMILHGWLCICS